MTHPTNTELVERWVGAWADSRSAEFERAGSGWLVDVEEKTRVREYIVADPTLEALEEFVALTERQTETWLTVIGELTDEHRAVLARLAPLTHDETMMAIDLVPVEQPEDVHVRERGSVAFATIAFDDDIAAQGQAAHRGTDIVVDRVETLPQFRRRGLGRQVMDGLTAWAVGRGATSGLLFASTDGHALYGALGWRDVAPLARFGTPA